MCMVRSGKYSFKEFKLAQKWIEKFSYMWYTKENKLFSFDTRQEHKENV